jgi:peptidoglycan/LPS O-acetylase OafA/YrhL
MRNSSIDVLKFCCAIMVILLHAPFIGKSYVLPVTRCAIPCFLIISGFFIYSDNPENCIKKTNKAIKRMLRTALWATLLFFFIQLIIAFIHNDYSHLILTKKELIKFFIFNDNPWGFHLWYLFAYIYGIGYFQIYCEYSTP